MESLKNEVLVQVRKILFLGFTSGLGLARFTFKDTVPVYFQFRFKKQLMATMDFRLMFGSILNFIRYLLCLFLQTNEPKIWLVDCDHRHRKDLEKGKIIFPKT